MPKYLFEIDYTAEGSGGLLKDGGTNRRKALEKMMKSAGGKLESLYFTFGIRDAIAIVDLPDNATAAAVSLTVSASGALAFKTTALLTAAEIDSVAKKKVHYRAPGG